MRSLIGYFSLSVSGQTHEFFNLYDVSTRESVQFDDFLLSSAWLLGPIPLDLGRNIRKKKSHAQDVRAKYRHKSKRTKLH